MIVIFMDDGERSNHTVTEKGEVDDAAFQNCHRAAVFRPAATAALAEFTSARSQLLNQSPELVNC